MFGCCCQKFTPLHSCEVIGAVWFAMGQDDLYSPYYDAISGRTFVNGGHPAFDSSVTDQQNGPYGAYADANLLFYGHTHYLSMVWEEEGTYLDTSTCTTSTRKLKTSIDWDARDSCMKHLKMEVDNGSGYITRYEYTLYDDGSKDVSGTGWLTGDGPTYSYMKFYAPSGGWDSASLTIAEGSSLWNGSVTKTVGSCTDVNFSLSSNVTLSTSTTLTTAMAAAEDLARLIDLCDYTTAHSWWDTLGRSLPQQFAANNFRFVIRYTRPLISAGGSFSPPEYGAIALRWYAQTSPPFLPTPWVHGLLFSTEDCTPASCALMLPGQHQQPRDWYVLYARKMDVAGDSYDPPVDEYHHFCSVPSAIDGSFSCDTCDYPGADGSLIYNAHNLTFVIYDPKGEATPGTLEADLNDDNIRGLATTGNTGWLRIKWTT